MNKILIAAAFAVLAGCGNPTPENHCCKEGDCGGVSTYRENSLCLYTMVKDLEKELEVLKLKHEYECKGAK